MGERMSAALALHIGQGQETIWATVEPGDEDRLKKLIGERQVNVSLDESADTEGHAASDELFLDVEGHAVAVRLPTAADAAAVRRAFALGVVTASLVVGAAAAAVAGANMIGAQPAEAPPAPAVQADAPSSDTHPLHRPVDIQRE